MALKILVVTLDTLSHLLVAKPPPRSVQRQFLHYVDDIEQYVDQGTDATNFRYALNAIHSGVINTCTDSLPLLGARVAQRIKSKP